MQGRAKEQRSRVWFLARSQAAASNSSIYTEERGHIFSWDEIRMKATENVTLKLKDPLGSIVERQKQQGDTFWTLCWFFFFFKVQVWKLLKVPEAEIGLPGWLQWWNTHLPMQETQETWVQSVGREDPLEEDMAAHSSILAGSKVIADGDYGREIKRRLLLGRITWTAEPGGPQSMGPQRASHGWSTHAQAEITERLWLMIRDHPSIGAGWAVL